MYVPIYFSNCDSHLDGLFFLDKFFCFSVSADGGLINTEFVRKREKMTLLDRSDLCFIDDVF